MVLGTTVECVCVVGTLDQPKTSKKTDVTHDFSSSQ